MNGVFGVPGASADVFTTERVTGPWANSWPSPERGRRFGGHAAGDGDLAQRQAMHQRTERREERASWESRVQETGAKRRIRPPLWADPPDGSARVGDGSV